MTGLSTLGELYHLHSGFTPCILHACLLLCAGHGRVYLVSRRYDLFCTGCIFSCPSAGARVRRRDLSLQCSAGYTGCCRAP
jgi:hypothetical protein